jgi:hypothetical protein
MESQFGKSVCQAQSPKTLNRLRWNLGMEGLRQKLSDEFHYEPHISSLTILRTSKKRLPASLSTLVLPSSPRSLRQPAQNSYHLRQLSSPH